jgi:hypothetical protein
MTTAIIAADAPGARGERWGSEVGDRSGCPEGRNESYSADFLGNRESSISRHAPTTIEESATLKSGQW